MTVDYDVEKIGKNEEIPSSGDQFTEEEKEVLTYLAKTRRVDVRW